MLTEHEKARIHYLAARKFTLRAIGQRTGHSKRTIVRVLRQPIPAIKLAPPAARPPRRQKEREAHFSVDYARCAGCGLLVKHPCLACRIERLKMLDQFRKAA